MCTNPWPKLCQDLLLSKDLSCGSCSYPACHTLKHGDLVNRCDDLIVELLHVVELGVSEVLLAPSSLFLAGLLVCSRPSEREVVGLNPGRD